MKIIKNIKVNIFWRKAKKELKREIYKALSGGSDYITFGKKLVEAYKDYSVYDIKKEFIRELAGFAHEQAVKEREKENTKSENAFAEK